MPKQFVVNKYEQRNRDLLTLGYTDYHCYLHSSQWAEIRQSVIDRAEGVCEVCCDHRASQVHHRSYDIRVLLGKCNSQLVAVCGYCHRFAEVCPGGNKRTLCEANRIMEARAWKDGRVLPGICRTCRKNPTGEVNIYCGRCKVENAAILGSSADVSLGD